MSSHEKYEAHLRRSAWYGATGNTRKALSHFGRALYYGTKRGRDDDDMDPDYRKKRKEEIRESIEAWDAIREQRRRDMGEGSPPPLPPTRTRSREMGEESPPAPPPPRTRSAYGW